MDVCKYCCEWVHLNRNRTPEEIVASYPKMMRTVLMQVFGFGKPTADEFVSCACAGNWEHMWETDDEKQLDAKEYKDKLIGDVWYCSDRWSYDRVIRVQWLYQRLCDRVKGIA